MWRSMKPQERVREKPREAADRMAAVSEVEQRLREAAGRMAAASEARRKPREAADRTAAVSERNNGENLKKGRSSECE